MEPEHPSVPDFYVDAMRVNLSNFTMTMEFGIHEMPATSTDDDIVRPVVRVRMSPQHAKAVMTVLQQLIAPYEEAHGEIRLGGILVEVGKAGGETEHAP